MCVCVLYTCVPHFSKRDAGPEEYRNEVEKGGGKRRGEGAPSPLNGPPSFQVGKEAMFFFLLHKARLRVARNSQSFARWPLVRYVSCAVVVVVVARKLQPLWCAITGCCLSFPLT